MPRSISLQAFARAAIAILAVTLPVLAQQRGPSQPAPNLSAELSSLNIPRLQASPKLADFESMEPASDLARKMLKITTFTQKEPHDGAPASQQTEAYLGYTDKNFYAVFLAFDKEPKKLRARMLRRELIDDDDQVGMLLDTFHDHRHAYYFYVNPYGIQQDGLWSETQGPDNSFDTVWHTYTKITSNGFMVILEVPFKSLRFRQESSASWGVILVRVIPRNGEHSFFPVNTNRVQGTPTQEGTINGFQDEDGCPDKGETAIILSPDRIETLDPIQFNGLKITRASTPLIEQVGATLRAHAEIVRLRVTVHVQPTNDSEADQARSDKRAQAVRD